MYVIHLSRQSHDQEDWQTIILKTYCKGLPKFTFCIDYIRKHSFDSSISSHLYPTPKSFLKRKCLFLSNTERLRPNVTLTVKIIFLQLFFLKDFWEEIKQEGFLWFGIITTVWLSSLYIVWIKYYSTGMEAVSLFFIHVLTNPVEKST